MRYIFLAAIYWLFAFPAYAEEAEPTLRDFTGWQHAMSDMRKYPVIRKGKTFKDMVALLQRVNDQVNKVDYVPDGLVYGKPDYWATEREFINFGGMCRDYVTEKYRVMRRLGYADSEMEMAVVVIPKTGELHSLFVIYSGEDTFVLDNRDNKVHLGDYLDEFKVVFFINRTGWWWSDV